MTDSKTLAERLLARTEHLNDEYCAHPGSFATVAMVLAKALGPELTVLLERIERLEFALRALTNQMAQERTELEARLARLEAMPHSQ